MIERSPNPPGAYGPDEIVFPGDYNDPMGLFPYQVEGWKWLHVHPKSVLADEMGLGKTIQIGRLIHYFTFSEEHPLVLIVGPSVLAYNWQEELWEKFQRRVEVAVGTGKRDLDTLSTGRIVYVNYDKFNVKRFNDVLQQRPWGTVIVDESHKIKGHQAKRSIQLRRVAQRAARVHFLTGTPYPQGTPADVFVALSSFDVGIGRRGFWGYVRDWCESERVEVGDQSWMTVGPAKQPHVFSGMMSQRMLRRTRDEVGRQLPSLTKSTIRHSLSPRQKTLYRSMRKALSFVTKAGNEVEAPNTAVQWQRLREVCLSPRLFDPEEEVGAKVEAIGEIVEQAYGANRKVVIFTWHRHFAFLLEKMIEDAYGNPPHMILGGMTPQSQYAQAAGLGDRQGFDVLIGTIAAMGVGLNLQAASVAIFAEISYVPDENDQALARLHREGQTSKVNAYYFIAKGTIEEYIHEQVIVKKQNIKNLLDAHKMAQEMNRKGRV